jgi:hypothetical protein
MLTLYYKVSMKAINRTVAIVELLLVLPGVLFMTALFVRNLQPAPYEPARSARLVVDWFSARPLLGLDVFLIALPFAAFVIGCVAILRRWRSEADLRLVALQTLAAVRSQGAALLTAGATLVAGGILATVALHMISD